jgi:hypothetical protein
MGLKSLRSCPVLCLVVSVAGCGIQAPVPIGIAVSPQSATVAPAQTIQFAATVTDTLTGIASPATAENNATGVTWSATEGTICASGQLHRARRSAEPDGCRDGQKCSRSDQGRQRHATGGGARESLADGQRTSGALFHFDGRVGECLGAVWTRHQLWTDDLDAAVARGRCGQPVRRGNEGQHALSQRAVVQFSDGTQFTDTDPLFTTGAVDPAQAPAITTATVLECAAG